MSDPNFPPNLNIIPLQSNDVTDDRQREAIATYGIAGRVWLMAKSSSPSREATRPLLEYFTPSHTEFDPPCSLFQPGQKKVIELGSGQSVASLHLANNLSQDDLVVLTDLPEVIPLCQRAIDSATDRTAGVVARPLAWGGDVSDVLKLGPFTHILMCDLIYFPHLYPLLLHTLLTLTEREGDGEKGETFGPEVILSYTSRTLALEESFFNSLALYFHTTPVRGGDWEAKVFLCRRWKVTEDWTLPGVNKVMGGSEQVIRGRSYDLVDDLFGSLDWEV